MGGLLLDLVRLALGIVLEWRLAAPGDTLANAGSCTGQLAVFKESLLKLAAGCLLALLAAWQLCATDSVDKPRGAATPGASAC